MMGDPWDDPAEWSDDPETKGSESEVAPHGDGAVTDDGATDRGDGDGAPDPDADPESVPATAEASDDPFSIAHASLTGGSLEAGAAFNAGAIVNSQVQLSVSKGDRLEQLSRDHFQVLDREALEGLSWLQSLDSRLLARGQAVLAAHGLLFLVGLSGRGKGTVGLAVARTLLVQDEADQVLLCQRLETQVRVNVHRLGQRLSGLERKILIFEDPLRFDNRDLARFLQDLDAVALRSLAVQLKAEGTRLLFTLDEATLGDRLDELRRAEVVLEVPPPGSGEILALLRQEASILVSDAPNPEDLRLALDRLLEEKGPQMCARFRGLPEAVRFCRRFLLQVLEGGLPLEVALDQHSDNAAWFLGEAERDRQGWCDLLALTLATPTASTATVPWLVHRELSRMISEALRRHLVEHEKERSPRELFLDHLEDGRLATVEMRTNGQATVLRWIDRDLSERLWSALLGSGRTVSWWVAPLLERCVQSGGRELQEVAAQALGRIGALSPQSLLHGRLDRWAEAEEMLPSAIPNLFAGALAAGSSELEEGLVRWMRHGVQSGTANQVQAVFRCFPVLARQESDLALAELRRALEKRLGDTPERHKELTGRLQVIANAIRELLEDDPNSSLVKWSVTPFFGKGQEVFLNGVGFALTGFCLNDDRLEVLRQLVAWCEDDGDVHSLLVVILFFQPMGVLTLVEQFPVHVRRDSSEEWSEEACSRFLASAMVEEAAEDVARFFEVAFGRFAEVPVPFRRSLRDRLLEQLRAWGRKPPPGEVAEALVQILSRLVRSRHLELRTLVFDLLKHDPTYSRDDAPGREIARRALSPPRSNRPGGRLAGD